MKFYLYFLVVFAIQALPSDALSSSEKKELMLTATMACKKEAGATTTDLRELMSRVLPTTREGKCMRNCFFKKLNVIQDGKLSLNGVDELAKATTNNDAKKMKIAHEIAEQCVNVSDEDECEYVGKLLACFMDAAKERGIDGKKMF